jgi:C-terminal processing protease CtpA/Prc
MSDELGKIAADYAGWSNETFILGIVISRENQLPTISYIIPNSAASAAELKTRDIVETINDRDVSGMCAEEITDLIVAFSGGAFDQLTFVVRYQTMENRLGSYVINRSHIPKENPYNQLIGYLKKQKSRNQKIQENLEKMVETDQIMNDL